MSRYLAHRADDGREQTVEEHLKAVSKLSSRFADAFNARSQGEMIGLAHDIGKCSDAFQKRLQGGRVVDHASAGALECAKLDAWWAASCVAGHHGGLGDVGNQNFDQPGDPTLIGRIKKAAVKEIPPYEVPIPLFPVPDPPGYGVDGLTDSHLTRFLYSCLVDADYLDTESFMSGGVRRETRYDSMPCLLEMLERYVSGWWEPIEELNKLRCDVLRACMEEGGLDRGLFTLTVPTGGGKTIASMAFALRHAVQHGMDRVIYVIPYTSIIEQTADVFRGIFGAENVVEHHSNAVGRMEDCEDAAQYRFAGATENWDAPIIVTTAVQFFESFYANRPSKCRKLHNVANSIVIFDEAQMLPAEHLKPCVAAISALAKLFRSSAVLCTATQPVIDDLLHKYVPECAAVELCPHVGEMFRRFRRVTFAREGMLDAGMLAERLAEYAQVLCIVNSRKAAQEVYSMLPPEGSYHLSTLMYPAHRRAVLATVRDRLKRGLVCRVVSTSLVEAGVDVDFPAVYREMAGLDSILQAAGRCNREGKRNPEESVVTVFEGVSATPPLLKMNIGAAREVLKQGVDPADPETVERYFRQYRSLLGESNLDKAGVVSAFEKGISGCILPFCTVAERFHLIDDCTRTIYIPDGEGEALVDRIRSGERTRILFRRLGQFGVSVYEWQFQALLNAGNLEMVDDDNAILLNKDLYVQKTGLMLCDNNSTGIFL